MLPLEATYFTQNGSQVTRVSTSEVKLSNGGGAFKGTTKNKYEYFYFYRRGNLHRTR